MHFRIFLQQLRRGTKRTLLYTFILMAVSAFLVMSLNLYKNSTANLQSAEETYTTIALMELYGDVNSYGELVEPFSEDYAGNKAVAVEGYDISEIVKAGTYDAKVTRNVNFTGLNGSDPIPVVDVATETMQESVGEQ